METTMAKYTINHICGHQSVADICGPESGRAGQRDRMETRMCSDCYHKQQAQAVAAASTELPTLIGSDKQVQWALTIRVKMLADAQRYADQKSPNQATPTKSKICLLLRLIGSKRRQMQSIGLTAANVLARH